VKQNDHSIGYVELAYAMQNNLGVGHVLNEARQFVEPRLESVTVAGAAVAATLAPDLRASIVNPPGRAAYPIAGFTYQLVYRQIRDRARAFALARLIWWELHEGQASTGELGYAPLPEAVVARAEEQALSIASGGEPVLAG
jgi:phosphate transport system substrate-binding protein